MTLHWDRFDEGDLPAGVSAYDRRREQIAPYREQRDVADWGEAAPYGWSEDKARQYAQPQRTGFGAYVRRCGLSTD
jgi:nitroreductase/FMN reductase [NAD(P)H]